MRPASIATLARSSAVPSPMMVAPERLVPGIRARHCSRPTSANCWASWIAAASAASQAPRAESKLGTGHGEREDAWVEYTSFERARSQPDEVVVLHYDSRENLIAMGVIPARTTPQPPNPFPGERNGFVPDPPARR